MQLQMSASSVSVSMASEAAETTVAGEAGVGERKRKKTLGRRKIEIKPIESTDAKHVCFSKRRDGLYKKANELCAMTGAKVAIIVFSPAPAGKPYSYGHPSANVVVDRHLDPDLFYPGSAAAAAFEAPPPPLAYEFDAQKDALENAIAAEARRKDALDKAARAAGVVWTEDTARQATMPDLVAMLAALERVNDDIHMAQQCAAAAAAGAYDYDLGDGTSFTADNYGGVSSGSRHQQAAMDAHMAYLMGGNGVGHAAAHAPMLLPPPPDLPPPPAPVPLAYNYGADHNHVTGYEGYAYDLGDGGGGHGAAYEMDGFYSGPTAATCNFFG